MKCKKILLLILFFLITNNSFALNNLDPFQSSVFNMLPSKMRDAISNAKVSIEYSAPNGADDKLTSLCKKSGDDSHDHNVGLAISKFDGSFIVKMHPLFLQEIAKGPEGSGKSTCGHDSLYRLAQATLIHELSHVYDSLNNETKEEKARRSECQEQMQSPDKPKKYSDAFCSNVTAKRTSVSESARYQKITGWQKEAFGFTNKNKGEELEKKDGTKITLNPRGINYEDHSIHEHFAVNMEHFILDPEYRCRRPALYSYLVETVGTSANNQNSNCNVNYDINYSTNNKKINIDPSRVYQVHYLLADKGDTTMSRWGHSMFRLVVCAPERKEVGPDCMKDTKHHVVLSHRANLKDLNVDYMGMVMGDKIPLKLFVMPFEEVREEYTKTELRDLKSVPLKFSEKNKSDFIDTALEQYWGFTGRYAFLSQNCATESAALLQAAVPETSSVQELNGITPTGILDEMESAGIANTKVFSDLKKAEKNGYLFTSNQKTVLKAISQLRGAGAIPNEMNLESYISLPAKDRNELALSAINNSKAPSDLSGKFYLVESYIRRKQDEDIKKEVQKVILEGIKGGANSEKIKNKIENIKKVLESKERWRSATYGYGVPLV